MAGVKITIKGIDRAVRRLKALGEDINKKVAPALFQEAEEIMGRSKELVPVDTGVLRSSGHVKRPEVDRNGVRVTLAYGGPAEAYALIVHENLRARHPVGQAKFLEQPLLEALPEVKRAVGKALDRARRKRS